MPHRGSWMQVSSQQRVEHYEMAGNGTVHNFSELLGEKEAARLLAETLQEEKAADKQLTALAKSIDVEAKSLTHHTAEHGSK